MAHEKLSGEVEQFLKDHIHSVAQLEALLLLHRAPPGAWDADTMARRLYAQATETLAALHALLNDGFLTKRDGHYFYEPNLEQRARVSMLDDAYSRHLIAITQIIHANPRRIQGFSDAFRIRKD